MVHRMNSPFSKLVSMLLRNLGGTNPLHSLSNYILSTWFMHSVLSSKWDLFMMFHCNDVLYLSNLFTVLQQTLTELPFFKPLFTTLIECCPVEYLIWPQAPREERLTQALASA